MRSWIITIAIVAISYLYFQSQQADRDATGSIVVEGNIDAFDIRVGDCFNDQATSDEANEISGVEGVPCGQPHDNEVYAVFNSTFSSFPGVEAMSEAANTGCIDRFEAFVGLDYQSSSLYVYPMFPTLESWNQADDRGIVCALYDMDLSQLEGSMRGTGI